MSPSHKQRAEARKEALIQQALAHLQSQAKPDVRGTARQFKVNPVTLWRRWTGRAKPRRLAHEAQQILSNAQEQALVEWTIHLSDIGRPLTKRTLRKKVQRIAELRRAPSRKWLKGFLARNTNVRLGKPSGMDPKRAQAFNETTVKNHFDLLREVMEAHGIPWEHVYNMDEKGIQRGGHNQKKYRYLIPRSRRPAYKLRSANLELVTVIECVRADGESLKPAFIFPGKEFHKEWFEVDPDILVCMSPNGWTDDSLCAEWFEHTFIPQATAQRISDAPILLIYDGHGSHATPRVVELALEHNIHLFCLPPHTTHKLQPLDVGCFSQLQAAWENQCQHVTDTTHSEVRKQDIVREYMAARERSMTPSLICKAFKKCGLNPLSPDIFVAADFAPSANTSHHAHLPTSYPCQLDHSATDGDAEGFDDIFAEDTAPEIDPEDAGGISEGDPDSDEDWEYSTDEDVLDDDLSTRYSRPPVLVLRRDGTTLNPASFGSSSASSASSASSPSHSTSPTSPVPTATPSESQSTTITRQPSLSSHSIRSSTMPSSIADDLLIARSNHYPSHLRYAAYERAIRAHEAWNQKLQANFEASELHAGMAALEVEELQMKLNAKNAQREKTRTLRTDSTCFTSGPGLEAWKAQEAQRQNKEAERKSRDEARARKAQEQAAVRGDQAFAYKGGLSKQLLPDLQALVHELGITLSSSRKRPTRDLLKKEIQKFFDDHPERREQARYRGLFERTRKRQADSDVLQDENERPARRRRLQEPDDAPSDSEEHAHHPPLSPHAPAPAPAPTPLTPRSAHPFPDVTPLHGSRLSNSPRRASSSRTTLDTTPIPFNPFDFSHNEPSPSPSPIHTYPYSYSMYHSSHSHPTEDIPRIANPLYHSSQPYDIQAATLDPFDPTLDTFYPHNSAYNYPTHT